MAISGHHSKASLRNYIGRPSSEKIRACSDILSDTLSGNSHQSLQPSFAALSWRAIFMFRWIRLSFIQKTLATQEVGRNTRLRLVFLPTLLTEQSTVKASLFVNLNSCYNFALVLHENALLLSRSDVRNFFHVHYYWSYVNSPWIPRAFWLFLIEWILLFFLMIYWKADA